MVAFILLLNPNHLDPLFNTNAGRAFLVLWFVMMVAGWYSIKKIIEIDI
jgi:Flp pilus assembly protein TadB